MLCNGPLHLKYYSNVEQILYFNENSTKLSTSVTHKHTKKHKKTKNKPKAATCISANYGRAKPNYPVWPGQQSFPPL